MIDGVKAAVNKAGIGILAVYSGSYTVELKKDLSPVTKADLAAQKILLKELVKVLPVPVLSEESPVSYKVRKNWKRYWLIDPLDGTKDFIAGNGEFTVNVALIEGHSPRLGVVYAPFLKLFYWAERGNGAFCNGKRIYNKSTRKNLIAADSIFHSTEETKAFLAEHKIRQIKRFGSALKLCKLAEGVIDLYPRFNGTKEWDTAAGQVIANEGGCKVVDMVTKKELVYNKPELRNNYFIASRKDLNYL